jgi:Transposase DDE domain
LEHPLQGTAASSQKSLFHKLLDAVFADASQQKMVASKEEASIDSTGLEAGHRSAHYAHRIGQKRYRLRRWPKLTLACHNATHLLIHALVSDGPSQDAPLLAPVLRDACKRVKINRLLADAGYDAEHNHAYARNTLGIGTTAIKLNKRGGRRWAQTKYRRQMYRRFPKVKYRQRVQVESSISRFKRRLTSSLRGRSRSTQRVEVYLRVMTHDLLLLAG